MAVAWNKIFEVVISPVDVFGEWLKEPLKRSEHKRQEESKDRDVKRDIERQIGVEKSLSEQRIRERQFEAKLENDKQHFLSEQKKSEEQFTTEMHIKRETEIVRILADIEQLKRDKEFERMKTVSDAMMEYQKELTRINVDAVETIGSMRIELQRKVYDLIHEKTQQYKDMQYKAIQQAKEQSIEINSIDLPDEYKSMLMSGVTEMLTSSIKEATRFVQQLNDDMQLINKDINLITTSGQQFIERHLQQFQLIGFSEQTTALLSQEDSSKLIIRKTE